MQNLVSNQKIFAVVIGIEKYQRDNLPSVDFASNDVDGFVSLLTEKFNVKENDIKVYKDDEATKTSLENDIPYYIGQLKEDETFVFYYAGHGFYSNWENQVTVYDTVIGNLLSTSLSLKSLVLQNLDSSPCKRSLLFLDCCAKNLKNQLTDRSIITDFSDQELEEFVQKEGFRAIYTSCSPGQASYPSSKLSHGIWTYHLLHALNGNVPFILNDNSVITDRALTEYLSKSVISYIRNETIFKKKQTPRTFVDTSLSINLIQFKEEEISTPELHELLRPNSDEAHYYSEGNSYFKDADGFDKKKGHFVPKDHNQYADAWANELLAEEVEEEIQDIYSNCKKILGLKRRDIQKGDATIDTDYFRYEITVGQDEETPDEIKKCRILYLMDHPSKLPPSIDNVFPYSFDELRMPYKTELAFDDLVDKFEDITENQDIQLNENEKTGLIELTFPDGLELCLSTFESQITFRTGASGGPLALDKEIKTAIAGMKLMPETLKGSEKQKGLNSSQN